MNKTVIVSGARTPFAKFGGALRSCKATTLGGHAVKAALNRAELNPADVEELLMGNVLQGGQGQIPSRQAGVSAGLPWSVQTETINKVCASGMRTITLGEQLIRLGDREVVVAGGMESMSQAPYFLPKARWGMRMGGSEVQDLLMYDGLTCSFTGVHMGRYGDQIAAEYEITRAEQDEWAYRSHRLAAKARSAGKLSAEITPIEVELKNRERLLVEHDEAPRPDTSLEGLAKLNAVFSKDGTITAGNAPGVNDGAGAVVLMSEERAKKEGKTPLATIVAHTALAVEAKDFPKTPGLVINQLLKKTGKTLAEIDIFEINEAFAAVALTSAKIANLDLDKVNVNGGAVALGHPIGASGTRIVLALAYELKRRGGGVGIAAICSGGGQGDAIMLEV